MLRRGVIYILVLFIFFVAALCSHMYVLSIGYFMIYLSINIELTCNFIKNLKYLPITHGSIFIPPSYCAGEMLRSDADSKRYTAMWNTYVYVHPASLY